MASNSSALSRSRSSMASNSSVLNRSRRSMPNSSVLSSSRSLGPETRRSSGDPQPSVADQWIGGASAPPLLFVPCWVIRVKHEYVPNGRLPGDRLKGFAAPGSYTNKRRGNHQGSAPITSIQIIVEPISCCQPVAEPYDGRRKTTLPVRDGREPNLHHRQRMARAAMFPESGRFFCSAKEERS